jgi:hypothetical protein
MLAIESLLNMIMMYGWGIALREYQHIFQLQRGKQAPNHTANIRLKNLRGSVAWRRKYPTRAT